DVVRLDPVGLGVEVGDQPVPQHRGRDQADVLGGDVRAAVQEGPGLASQHQELTRPRAGAPGDITANEIQGVVRVRARLPGQPHRVADHVFGDWHRKYD